VVAAVDFSSSAEHVAVEAAALSAATGAVLHLLHVAAPEPAFVGFDQPGGPLDHDHRLAELTEERRHLDDLAEHLATRTGVHARALVAIGPTAETIASVAEGFERALVVVGSHGHGALRRLLVGSTTDGLLRGSTRPVVVVPSRDLA
jgi:nucleotide-binding universal stress UspA family protein